MWMSHLMVIVLLEVMILSRSQVMAMLSCVSMEQVPVNLTKCGVLSDKYNEARDRLSQQQFMVQPGETKTGSEAKLGYEANRWENQMKGSMNSRSHTTVTSFYVHIPNSSFYTEIL